MIALVILLLEKLPLIGWTAGEKSAVVDHPNDHVNTTSPRT